MSIPFESEPEPVELLHQISALISETHEGAAKLRASWPKVSREFESSAQNLAAYLALREHDLRPLQQSLMVLGLSSLGRLESRVVEVLESVRASLGALTGNAAGRRPSVAEFFAGEHLLRDRSTAMFGTEDGTSTVAIQVTCPSEAADDPDFFVSLARKGVRAIRINCAHDDRDAWQRMIEHSRTAAAGTGRPIQVFMDLAGPKIRTGKLSAGSSKRLQPGEDVAIACPGKLKELRREWSGFAIECTLDAPLRAAASGHRIFYDDGKASFVVERSTPWGVIARLEHCVEKGLKVKSEKGLNFPDTDFSVDALTDKDVDDLAFIAYAADCIEFSFVQSASDVRRLQDALAERRDDWQTLGLVLKIETAHAISRLPEIILQAASKQPCAVMIARGDLAVEIGFNRMAEMQEELLWVCEAAHVPVIWATQVLEHLVTKGTPSRGEMTDAAMAARAECVMLNKGPYLLDAIDALNTLLGRMAVHQHKKTSELRPLGAWTAG